VASLEDLKKLKGVCSGVIVGKALLDGVFSVEEGIKCLAN
ncbi:1-(5-phosphoribosyl)-5-((5-phosphoribosylamino)methylideneamino)imidazole-4-carboxamide isomerase, partial [Campylobacter coli]|nr:1-(5-phosphoribosyl)-5-((5-phosphoribosylamino)methylideneamino)imidazole-4-carboxamide isomerase [Campylobacter coli]ELJ5295911.1 1-(5-phosphoribosyl)-5-((5-phosphoribosylamino)methylideneamino)imidazole-4-carboxamide isomerase [Campylobacter coli]